MMNSFGWRCSALLRGSGVCCPRRFMQTICWNQVPRGSRKILSNVLSRSLEDGLLFLKKIAGLTEKLQEEKFDPAVAFVLKRILDDPEWLDAMTDEEAVKLILVFSRWLKKGMIVEGNADILILSLLRAVVDLKHLVKEDPSNAEAVYDLLHRSVFQEILAIQDPEIERQVGRGLEDTGGPDIRSAADWMLRLIKGQHPAVLKRLASFEKSVFTAYMKNSIRVFELYPEIKLLDPQALLREDITLHELYYVPSPERMAEIAVANRKLYGSASQHRAVWKNPVCAPR